MKKKCDLLIKFLFPIYGILIIVFFAQTHFLNAQEYYTEDQSGLATCLGVDQAERLEATAFLEEIRTSSFPPAWTFNPLEGSLCDQNANLVRDGAISF